MKLRRRMLGLMTVALCALACALGAACEEVEEVTEPPVILVAAWGDLDASVERMVDGPHEFVAPLPSHAVLVGSGDILHRLDPIIDVPVFVSDELAMPSAVAGLDTTTAAVASAEGLFVLEDDSLRLSPLSELFADWEVTAMLAVPRGQAIDLWLASPDGLRLHRDGRLHEVAVGDLATADAKLAWGPTVDGLASLWVAAGDDLYSITASGDSLTALPVVDGPELPVEHLVSDAAGRLWAAGGGEVHRRLGSETWQDLVSPAEVVGLFGRPDDSAVFILTDELLVAQGEGFYAVTGAPTGLIADIDSLGRLLVLGEEGLERVSVGRPVGFLGLQRGEQLGDLTALRVLPAMSGHVTGMSATLNGAAVEFAESSWTLTLDPLEFDDGAHSLEFTIAYDDLLDPVVATFLFSVGEFVPPTWEEDIRPLFSRECAECHTDQGVSRPLDTPASWQADLDLILSNLQEQRMPLPPRDPLSQSEIQLVRAWAAGGFPE